MRISNQSLLDTTGQSSSSNQHLRQATPAQIAASMNSARKEQLRLQGLEYEPEEQPIYRFEVRELQKAKENGQLYLSSYKLFFMPNSVRDPAHARYFAVPYGMIYGYTAQASEGKNQGTITIFCKDERVFKFKFETSI